MKKTIVISAIALRSGGTLSILQDCMQELSDVRYADFIIYVLIKDHTLLNKLNDSIKCIEINGTGSYARRLYYEYVYFKKLSRRLKPALWFSLHDITPNVEATKQVVYCHNPSPFYRISLQEFFLDPKFGLFNYLYRFLYQINIRRNDYIIVQQDWMRQSFARLFNIRQEKIIVAHPNVFFSPAADRMQKRKTFLYPVFPRVFKNIELIAEAIHLLAERGIYSFDVMITIQGTENKYARWIKKKYGHLSNLVFMGSQSREKVFELYSAVDYLVFPSKLETWGLPISEFKQTGKPALLADLPYAHETAGTYDQAYFFDPSSREDLASKMEKLLLNKDMDILQATARKIEPPMANDWRELFTIINA